MATRTRAGKALVEWREREGLSRSEAADVFGCTYYWIRLIEDHGRRPGKTLRRFIEAQTHIAEEHWQEVAA